MTPDPEETRGSRAERRAAWALLSPALGAIALFFALPLIAALLLSLNRRTTSRKATSTGMPSGSRPSGVAFMRST